MLELLRHLAHNDHGEWSLIFGFVTSWTWLVLSVLRAARPLRLWRWLRCRCSEHPHEHTEFLDGLPGWYYRRCTGCGRVWLHFRDECYRVSPNDPVLTEKTWKLESTQQPNFMTKEA